MLWLWYAVSDLVWVLYGLPKVNNNNFLFFMQAVSIQTDDSWNKHTSSSSSNEHDKIFNQRWTISDPTSQTLHQQWLVQYLNFVIMDSGK